MSDSHKSSADRAICSVAQTLREGMEVVVESAQKSTSDEKGGKALGATEMAAAVATATGKVLGGSAQGVAESVLVSASE
jgi:hypothetical protein